MNGMNAAEHVEVRVTQRLNAPPDRVFAAWLDPKLARRWLFATASRPMTRVSIDARVGGCFRFAEDEDGEATEYSGVYVEVTPSSRLVFTLAIDRQPKKSSQVTVEIMPWRGGSAVTLIQERVPLDHASGTEGRWTGLLYGLGITLEAGQHTLRLERKSPSVDVVEKAHRRRLKGKASQCNDEEIRTCDS